MVAGTTSLPKVVSLLSLCLLARAMDGRANDLEREPIRYSTSKPQNAVSRLEEQLSTGKAKLRYEERFGYLRSLLRELDIRVSSQTLVFSKTSLQRHRISPETPRAVYFGDEAYVGFCRNGDVLEVSAVDPKLGTVFYTLEQTRSEKPRLVRQTDNCLLCHGSSQNQGMPGHLIRSVFPDRNGELILSSGSHRIDHTSPLEQRWGGWYVTGTHGKQTHLGNLVIKTRHVEEPVENRAGMNLRDLGDRINRSTYLSPHSDIVALMVLEHQTEGHNLLARAGLQTRMALHQEAALNRELGEKPTHRWDSTRVRIQSAGDPVVRYFLFAEEAELKAKIAGTSTFAADFVKPGPRDGKDRSLRDLDLERRLFRYPCSYLIYSPAFDALPGEVKEHIYRRLWEVLTGRDTGKEFSRLSADDRKNIREILIATKPGLPDYWRLK